MSVATRKSYAHLTDQKDNRRASCDDSGDAVRPGASAPYALAERKHPRAVRETPTRGQLPAVFSSPAASEGAEYCEV